MLHKIHIAGCLAILAAAALGQPAPTRPVSSQQGAPVVLDGQTLFVFQTGLGPFSAKERADATEARLLDLAKELSVPVDAITAAQSDSTTDVVARDRVLLTLTEADAQSAQLTRAELANLYVQKIRAAVAQRRSDYSYRSLLLGGLYAVLATGMLVLLLWGFGRIFPALYRILSSSRGGLIRTIRLQRVELVSADQISAALIRLFKVIRAILVLTLLYVYVPLVFSFFPWTRVYAPTLFGYIVDPIRAAAAAFTAYLPSLAFVIVACLIAYGCVALSGFFFGHVAKGNVTLSGFYPEWAKPTHKIVRFLILAFTAVVIFPYLPGSDSPAFRGISIFLGVLLSLGSTSAVANIVAGTILTYTRAFQVGDRVRIADTVGDVVDKTLLATRVQTIKNEVVTVPNALVLGSHITNFSLSCTEGYALILHTGVTIGYDAPWRTVHELLISAALRTKGVLQEPRPFVLQTGLDDFYVHYEINAHTKEPSRMAVIYAELHQNIQDCFNEAGVEIMSPHYSSLRDGNRKAIPDPYLPETYAPPVFRVSPNHIGEEQAKRASTSKSAI